MLALALSVVLAADDAPRLLNLEPATAPQLEYERARLVRGRPRLGAPVTLLLGGGAAMLAGAVYLLIGSSRGLIDPITIFAIIVLNTGGILAGIGTYLLRWRLVDRAEWAEDLADLDARLRVLRTPVPAVHF